MRDVGEEGGEETSSLAPAHRKARCAPWFAKPLTNRITRFDSLLARITNHKPDTQASLHSSTKPAMIVAAHHWRRRPFCRQRETLPRSFARQPHAYTTSGLTIPILHPRRPFLLTTSKLDEHFVATTDARRSRCRKRQPTDGGWKLDPHRISRSRPWFVLYRQLLAQLRCDRPSITPVYCSRPIA